MNDYSISTLRDVDEIDTLKNNSNFDGADVIQVYIGKEQLNRINEFYKEIENLKNNYLKNIIFQKLRQVIQ